MNLNRRQMLIALGALGVAGCSGTEEVEGDASTPDGAPPNDDAPAADAAKTDAATTDAVAPSPDAATDAEDAATDPDVPSDNPPPPPPPGVDPFALPVNATYFPHAAMAGDMQTTSVILWTRYTGAEVLGVRVEEQVGSGYVVRHDGRLSGGVGNRVVEVGGLTPGARHRFVFFRTRGGVAVERSAVGTFRTAFAPGSREVITFGGLSCTNGYKPDRDGVTPPADFNLLRQLATQRNLDLLVHLGDHIYADQGTNDATTRAEFDRRYDDHYQRIPFRSMHLTTGWYFTWDDHEVRNNYDPALTSLVATARAAWFDHHPVRRNPAEPNRIWRSFRWGETAEFFVLDGRSERRLPGSTNPAVTSQYLSRAQMDWLKSSLAASTATFKFIVNSKPIVSVGTDSWNQFASARRELLDFILSPSRRIPGVVFLAGDVHYGAVGEVAVDSAGRALNEIIMGPGANDTTGVTRPRPFTTRSLAVTPGGDSIRNYTVVRADPATREVTVSFIGESGSPIPGTTYSFRV